jgi:hypothetical protein
MKTQLIKLTGLLLILAALATACKHEEEYPKDITFTEYFLPELCQWENLPYNDKIIIINSSEELKKYISCTENSIHVIDFSKETLLLASGKMNKGISKIITIDLQQHSLNKYSLSVEITLNDTIYTRDWTKAYIVDKMSYENEVKLNTSLIETPIDYPIKIHYEEYSLEGSDCKWKKYSGGDLGNELSIINTKEQLEKYLECFGDNNYPEIDFLENTLLLAYGSHPVSILLSNCSIKQHSACYYEMRIDLVEGVFQIVSPWFFPIIIRKIVDDADINLIVNIY